MTKLTVYLESLRTAVEKYLDEYSGRDTTVPARLQAAIRYSLLAPGKRLRPLLTLVSCELCGGTFSSAIPAACAVEMIHCYSLIHDDLPAMDNDDLRRGIPTCHRKFDDATAILAGDALQAMAFELLATKSSDPTVSGRLCGILAKAIGPTGLVGGQIDDVFLSQPDFSDQKSDNRCTVNGYTLAAENRLQRLDLIHRRKTAALFVASLQLGAVVAGAAAEQLAALEQYGQLLGLAFQITDDILDQTGDAAVVGKKLRKDDDQHKWTYPSIWGLDESIKQAQLTVEAACDTISTPDSTLKLWQDEKPSVRLAKTTMIQLVQQILHRTF